MTAFVAVTASAIALVAAAAVIGADRGLSAQEQADRTALATRTAAAASAAYQHAGGWDGADLAAAVALAAGGDARLVVRDDAEQAVTSTAGQGHMRGPTGMGGQDGMGGMSSGARTTPVRVTVTAGGRTVGSVTLMFPGAAQTAGRPVAWAWVGAAALAAVALAIAAGWQLSRSLTRPLAVLTSTTRAFAAGDRAVRTGLAAPGEVGELAAAFDAAAEQVQLSEQARKQMAADVAHELRTPLASLQAGLEELRDGLAPADSAALARLHDQTLRLGRVVSDLAELSAADASRLTMRTEAVDLTAVAREAADVHEAPLRAAGITLIRHLDGAVVVRGDVGRLHQVAGNLLQNCARHCRPGDTVTLALHHDPARRVAVLTVDDTGPGIAPELLPDVFTRFRRAGTGAGTGLGLAIARAIVEAHAGRIHAESDGRHGTRMTVELPAP